MAFPFYKQLNAMDCGPTCLRMISKYYGRHYCGETLRQRTGFTREGVSLLGISKTAEQIGFHTEGVEVHFEEISELPLPCILHWRQNHFVVLVEVNRKKYTIADPAQGIKKMSNIEFLSNWLSGNKEDTTNGIALLLEPKEIFYQSPGEQENTFTWYSLFKYLFKSKIRIIQVFIALIISSLLQLIFPFLTQSIVDTGIKYKNLQFVVIILIAEVMLVLSQTISNFIRGRLLLKISNILNLQILSDFWKKLTKLPVSYFDIHQTGDTLQRINDHKQIQRFLTGSAISTIFSVFNFLVYAVILITYNYTLFFIFISGSILYFFWISFFMKTRRRINYETFSLSSNENNATLQLIHGMQDIRMNNAEDEKRIAWEEIQNSIFKLNIKALNYSQYQYAGAILIIQFQNIAISFFVAKLVIEGDLTLGAMLAIQYIIGQLTSPINQWVNFIQSAQDAKISMERLNEIRELPNEKIENKNYIVSLPKNNNLIIENLSFSYPNAIAQKVLNHIDLEIPDGKVTAIVGISGSGKTTLLKILLKVYEQYSGTIKLGTSHNKENQIKFEDIAHKLWRDNVGAVMQDGFIYNDSIAGNIAVGKRGPVETTDLIRCCKIANIYSFIKSLPNQFETQLGVNGIGISQGQKQRILIARALYKNPKFLFFDEATNSLDAKNETKIVENLAKIFHGKTVVIVAHRLSTVKNADKIVVLNDGTIVEEGTHESLVSNKCKYYELVRNQLELEQ